MVDLIEEEVSDITQLPENFAMSSPFITPKLTDRFFGLPRVSK